MADMWDGFSAISTPAATDRILAATGSGAGGYTLRGDLVYKSAAGQYLIGVAGNAGAPALTFASDLNTGFFHAASDTIGIATGGTERVRIDGNGNVGIGTNAPGDTLQVAGGNVLVDLADTATGAFLGYPYSQQFTATSVVFPRFGLKWCAPSDGGGNAEACLVGYGGVRLYTQDALRLRILQDGAVRPGADNAQSFGAGSFRWSVLYSATGTINTCDVRFKTFRTDRQTRAAENAATLEIFDAFGFFQFNDAIEVKGVDGARWHYGPAAQEVWTIWAAHGLTDALVDGRPIEGSVPPAFLCWDPIDEETAPVMEGWRPSAVMDAEGKPVMVRCAEGEEATEQRPTGETIVTREAGHIFGVRIDQLHSLMLAALNKERKDHAARIAAQEARLAAVEAVL